MENKTLFANALQIAINENGSEVYISFRTTGPSFNEEQNIVEDTNKILDETSIIMSTDMAASLVTGLGQLVFGDKFVVSEEETPTNE